MAVGPVDLLHGRPHEPGELEEADPRRDRERRERVPKRIRRPVFEAGSFDGRRPLVAAPFVEIQIAAAPAGEEEGRVDPRRKFTERRENASGEEDAAKSSVLLPVQLHAPVRVDPTNANDGGGAVDVPAFQRDPRKSVLGMDALFITASE